MRFDVKYKLSIKESRRGLRFPKEMSKDIAELVGIHFGDGNLQIIPARYYRIYYSFNFKPFSIYIPKRKAKYILELPNNTIKNSGTKLGDKISF